MRSAASPRAVSISNGMSDFARSCRHNSRPSMSGSIRSSTSASKGSRASRSRPERPCAATETRKPASPKCAASRRHPRSAMSPTATVFLHARREFLALRGSEYFGRVGKGLRNAPGRLLGELEMLGAERLDRGPVDAVLREQLERFPARLAYSLAKRQQVFGRLLHDRRELLLLLLGGVDLDVKVLEHAIEVLVQGRGVERAGREAAAVPAAVAAPLREGFDADSGGDAADQRGDRRALEKATAFLGIPVLRFHGSSFPGYGERFPWERSLAAGGKRDLSGG